MVHKREPISEERQKEIKELDEFTDALLCIAVISKDLIDELLARHKEKEVRIGTIEKLAWKKIRDGASTLDFIAFSTGKENYSKFRNMVTIVKFLILELIAHCSNDDMKLWQFHNLLKTYKVVYPSLVQTIDKEMEAFASLFGQVNIKRENG